MQDFGGGGGGDSDTKRHAAFIAINSTLFKKICCVVRAELNTLD